MNNIFLCEFAEIHKLNPKWHDLKWKQIDARVKKRKEYDNAVYLSDLLDNHEE